MNRRNFLKLSSGGLLSAVCCSPLSYATVARGGTAAASGGDHAADIHLEAEFLQPFRQVLLRLRQVQDTVGYQYFNLLSFDDTLKVARMHASIGEFTGEEIKFIERIFARDAKLLGFFGDKVNADITATIPRDKVTLIPNTGHYLFSGKPLETFERAKKAVGESLVLTSGVRGVSKQTYLYLSKVGRTGGNMSLAARSVAPPGYSYHGTSDFDIGQRGMGLANFTSAFSRTEIHQRLIDQGLIEHRYPIDNAFGVRYEPWHIKVAG